LNLVYYKSKLLLLPKPEQEDSDPEVLLPKRK